MSHWWYLGLVLATGIARLFELRVAKRHEAWARANGGVERGAGHYPVMVTLHTAFLIACAAEVLAFDRPFLPWLGWPALAVLLASHALRWWCISTLGNQWNTKVIVVPGRPLVTGGPYRWIRHPNYVAVIAEIAALPLVHTAWVTFGLFTVANLVLLRHRVRVEEEALSDLAAP
jgi:methyltransferase